MVFLCDIEKRVATPSECEMREARNQEQCSGNQHQQRHQTRTSQTEKEVARGECSLDIRLRCTAAA